MILEGLDEMVAHYYEMDHVRRPFVIGVLGDFSGSLLQPLPPVGERHFLDIDYDNFSDRLKALRPRVAFRIATTVDLVSPAEVPVELIFTCLEDFSPIGVVRQVRGLRDWLDARKPVPPFIDGSIGRLAEREPKLETISALADGRHYEGVAREVASERDINIHQQLNAIFHHPDFQRLEATWRGLHWLVTHSAAGGNIRIRFFDISDSELRKVLKKFKGSARDSSPIFRKIYD